MNWDGLRIARASFRLPPSHPLSPCAPFTSLLHLSLERLCGFSPRSERNLPPSEVKNHA